MAIERSVFKLPLTFIEPNNMNNITNKTKTILFASMIVALILPFSGMSNAYADHTRNTSTWQTDMTYDINSSLNNVSHPSFTPDADFEDSINVWNSVRTSWFDFTRDDRNGDIDIGSWFMGWHISTLAETTWISTQGTMAFAAIDFNSAKDFRDINVSQGWWSYDFETVAIHEIGHVEGIHDHTKTASSPMKATILVNTVDRTLNSHDRSTIGGMY